MSEENKLYIYHLSQKDNNGYDTYSDCVVIAESEAYAITIHPSNKNSWCNKDGWGYGEWKNWANNPKSVIVKLIGEATSDHHKNGDVVCASFHAG